MQDGRAVKMPGFYRDFWLGPTISRVQLARFRMLFFALVAIDAFLVVGHAARYGAGDFNVPHFPLLAAITPQLDRVAVVVCALVLCYLAARVAIGVAARWLTVPIAIIYAILYFSSQLDSYQHHYLLALILAGACLIDWDAERPSGPGIRLILVQVSVVYLFAAIAKMETAWWDGRALEAMLATRSGSATDLIKALGFAPAAKLTVLTELFLAVAIHIRRLRLVAALIGVAFHAGIQLADFKIGLFSYYMLAIYLLVLPPRLFAWSELTPFGWRPKRGSRTVHLAIAAALAFALVAMLPLEGALVAAIVMLAGLIGRDRRIAWAHLVAAVAVLVLSLTTDAIRDHYRYWGGSSRRLGDVENATRAYERLVDLEPSYAPGRRNLAKLRLAAGEDDDALEHYRQAVRLEPRSPASHLGLAIVNAKLGNGPAAVASARIARELANADTDGGKARAMSQIVKQANAIERRFSESK